MICHIDFIVTTESTNKAHGYTLHTLQHIFYFTLHF